MLLSFPFHRFKLLLGATDSSSHNSIKAENEELKQKLSDLELVMKFQLQSLNEVRE